MSAPRCRSIGEFCYRLFFTRDDDLDVLQILYVAAVIFSLGAFALAAAGVWKVTVAAWSFLGAMIGTLAISGVPKWCARIIANAKSPAAVARAIAAARDPRLPSDADDERVDA